MTDNCDVFADVDFGHGSVEVRCTQVGKHENHKCEVILRTEKIPGEVGYKKPSSAHSVFDDTSEPVETGEEVSTRKRRPSNF